MDYASTFAISAAGMAIERARVEVAALNIANAHTVGQPGYRPLRVVAQARAADFPAMLSASHAASAGPVYQLEPTAAAPRQVHEPGHPLADDRGLVSYPGVDPATEMVSLMSATRAYEANVVALNTARHLALKALDIGGNT